MLVERNEEERVDEHCASILREVMQVEIPPTVESVVQEAARRIVGLENRIRELEQNARNWSHD